jgi:hypothetical protein
MNCVGECVCRIRLGLSPPRGESDPPITFTLEESAFNRS